MGAREERGAGTLMSWRDTIKVHPAAEIFPRMSDTELRELGDDIARHGLREKVKVVERCTNDGHVEQAD